jgi:hypothetical protein
VFRVISLTGEEKEKNTPVWKKILTVVTSSLTGGLYYGFLCLAGYRRTGSVFTAYDDGPVHRVFGPVNTPDHKNCFDRVFTWDKLNHPARLRMEQMLPLLTAVGLVAKDLPRYEIEASYVKTIRKLTRSWNANTNVVEPEFIKDVRGWTGVFVNKEHPFKIEFFESPTGFTKIFISFSFMSWRRDAKGAAFITSFVCMPIDVIPEV